MEILDVVLDNKGENFNCHFEIPEYSGETIISLLYNDDLIHEGFYKNYKEGLVFFMSHFFLDSYKTGDIKIVKDYFGHKGKEENNLFYIHPTKCGGSSIEQIGYEYGVRWGRWEIPKYDYHLPSNYFINLPNIKNKTLFTSVRNPYNRLISSVYCPYMSIFEKRSNKELDIKEFNEYLKIRIEKEFLLYDFVYHNNKKVIPHVLKQENLTEEFNKLMFDYNSQIRMNKIYNKSNSYYSYPKFGVEDINKENLKSINTKFEKDFVYFGYEMINY